MAYVVGSRNVCQHLSRLPASDCFPFLMVGQFRFPTEYYPPLAIRRLFRVAHDNAGNLPPMPGVFPDYPAPVVRNADGERELIMMRWGMPPPKFGGAPVTNIRTPLRRTGEAG
jgi:putative SOS response-associated peptidase YedK